MAPGISIGCNEAAARVLEYTCTSVLDLIVGEAGVYSTYHSTNLGNSSSNIRALEMITFSWGFLL
jgi:hypothetical protein